MVFGGPGNRPQSARLQSAILVPPSIPSFISLTFLNLILLSLVLRGIAAPARRPWFKFVDIHVAPKTPVKMMELYT